MVLTTPLRLGLLLPAMKPILEMTLTAVTVNPATTGSPGDSHETEDQ